MEPGRKPGDKRAMPPDRTADEKGEKAVCFLPLNWPRQLSREILNAPK
jgi:hypothetical protein